MKLNKIIDIVTTIRASGLGVSNLGKMLLLIKKSDLKPGSKMQVGDYKTYSDTTEVSNDLNTDSEGYKAASAWFAPTPKPVDIVIGIRDDTGDSLVDSLNKFNKKVWFFWYAFTKEAYADETSILAAATWGLTSNKMMPNCQINPDLIDNSNTDNVATKMDAQGIRTAFTEFNNGQGVLDAYAGIATAALFSRVDFQAPDATITAEYKAKTGITSMSLDTDAESTLLKNHVVFYSDITAGESTERGNVLNSITHSPNYEFIDDVWNSFAFVNLLEVEVFREIKTAKKLGITAKGQNALIRAARGVCDIAVENGYLGDRKYVDQDTGETRISKGYEILTKATDVYKLSGEKRAKREAYPIQIIIFPAGAIHAVRISVDIVI